MASRILPVLDAVVDAINAKATAGDFVVDFTAARRLLPSRDAEDMTGLEVSVFHRTEERDNVTRGAIRRRLTVGIAVSQRLNDGGVSTSDRAEVLIELCEQLADAFNTATRLADARWVGSRYGDATAPMFDVPTARTSTGFIGVVFHDFTYATPYASA